MANWVPAPMAGPLTAATTGTGASARALIIPYSAARNGSPYTAVRSAPEQKLLPAPVTSRLRAPAARASTTAAPTASQCSMSSALRRSWRSIVIRPTAPTRSSPTVTVLPSAGKCGSRTNDASRTAPAPRPLSGSGDRHPNRGTAHIR